MLLIAWQVGNVTQKPVEVKSRKNINFTHFAVANRIEYADKNPVNSTFCEMNFYKISISFVS